MLDLLLLSAGRLGCGCGIERQELPVHRVGEGLVQHPVVVKDALGAQALLPLGVGTLEMQRAQLREGQLVEPRHRVFLDDPGVADERRGAHVDGGVVAEPALQELRHGQVLWDDVDTAVAFVNQLGQPAFGVASEPLEGFEAAFP